MCIVHTCSVHISLLYQAMQGKKTEHYQREENSIPLHLSEGRGHLLRLNEQTQTYCKVRASLIPQHHCSRNTIATPLTSSYSPELKLDRFKLATLPKSKHSSTCTNVWITTTHDQGCKIHIFTYKSTYLHGLPHKQASTLKSLVLYISFYQVVRVHLFVYSR